MIVFAHRWLGRKVLEYLLAEGYEIDHVVVTDNLDQDIFDLAMSYGLATSFYHSKIQSQLANSLKTTDWLMSFWSPIIIGTELLERFENTVNVHPSLVPINQGSDCAAWTIRNKTLAGVSIMNMHSTLDTGDIYASKQLDWLFPIQGKQLHKALLDLCFEFFVEMWPRIYSGDLKPVPQKGVVSHHTRKQTNEDRFIMDLSAITGRELLDKVLAHDFSPRSMAEVMLDGEKYSLTMELKKVEEQKDG